MTLRKGTLRWRPRKDGSGRWYLDMRDGSPWVLCPNVTLKEDRPAAEKWRDEYILTGPGLVAATKQLTPLERRFGVDRVRRANEIYSRYQALKPKRTGYQEIKIDGKIVGVHRLVFSALLGRPLEPHENVHHKNGQRADNRPENLELWSTSQPSGQRAIEKLQWAKELIAAYGPIEHQLMEVA